MATTRRGFLGWLVALVAAPVVAARIEAPLLAPQGYSKRMPQTHRERRGGSWSYRKTIRFVVPPGGTSDTLRWVMPQSVWIMGYTLGGPSQGLAHCTVSGLPVQDFTDLTQIEGSNGRRLAVLGNAVELRFDDLQPGTYYATLYGEVLSLMASRQVTMASRRGRSCRQRPNGFEFSLRNLCQPISDLTPMV